MESKRSAKGGVDKPTLGTAVDLEMLVSFQINDLLPSLPMNPPYGRIFIVADLLLHCMVVRVSNSYTHCAYLITLNMKRRIFVISSM